jgi:GNAT superfamily N-acetyltransferase
VPENDLSPDMLVQVSRDAAIALEHRLYHSSHWVLCRDLLAAVDHPERYQVALHYEDEQPVGVFLMKVQEVCVQMPRNIEILTPSRQLYPQVYVQRDFRRKGIGTRLMAGVAGMTNLRANKGLKASEPFWRKLNIPPSSGTVSGPPESWVY